MPKIARRCQEPWSVKSARQFNAFGTGEDVTYEWRIRSYAATSTWICFLFAQAQASTEDEPRFEHF